jgi:Protein of unknown function (DUF1769)
MSASVLCESDRTDPRPSFPTLKCEIMTTDSRDMYIPCPPNMRAPVAFETDLFTGTALLLIRTDPIDSLFRPFFYGKKREFEIQVQGKFKRDIPGEVYCGVEVTGIKGFYFRYF